MADNITPAPINNGGTGSVQAPVSAVARAPDYRQLQNPENVRTDLPDPGFAQRAAALSQTFKEFSGAANEYAGKELTREGALAGAASGATGHPAYKEGLLRFSAYNAAFNNAATGAYAIQAEAQADDSAARLRIQANNDPNTFAATYTAVRDAVLKNAPPEAVPMLTELYNKRLANGLAAITQDQQTEIRNTQRQAYDVGVDRQTSRVAILQGSDNPQDQLQGLDERVKLSLLIDGGKNAGLYSEAEAKAMHISSERTITAQVFQTQFDGILSGQRKAADGTTGAVGAVNLLQSFQAAHIKNLSDPNAAPILGEAEYQKLYADGVTKLREYNLGIAALKRDGKTAEELKFEASDKQYTGLLLQGQLTDKALAAAVTAGDLKPERATSLHNMLLQGPQVVKSSPIALRNLHTDPNFLNMSIDDLAKYPGVSATDQLKAWEEIQRRNGTWEGTQASKQAMSSISAALKIPAGTPTAALSEDEKKQLVQAQQDYIHRMNDVEPAKRDSSAASVAQEVIKASKQRAAAADAAQQQVNMRSFIENYGPSSNSPMDDKRYQERLKWYQDQILRDQAASKGP